MRIARVAGPVLAALAALALSASPAPARAGDPPPPNPLRGGDIKALLDKAAEMKAKDVRALGAALTSLGDALKDPKDTTTHPADLDFLVEYVMRETARAPRILAVDAVQRIDAAGASAAFLKKAQSEKDTVRAALAIEAAGWTGSKADVPALLALVKSPSELVATAAAEALARVATPKDVDDIMDAGLTHPSSHVTDHTAWAVQDLLIQQKPKVAVEKYLKIASKKGDPRSIRADATAALLQDKSSQPHKWASPFAAAKKALAAAPAAPPVKGNSAEHVAKVQAAVNWIRDKLPGEYWLVCASVSAIEVATDATETAPQFDTDAIKVKLSDSILAPQKLGFTILMQSGVLWRKRIGEPHTSHRGWEPAIFDLFDLCVVGRMYDAGPGGVTRDKLVALLLEKKVWGTL